MNSLTGLPSIITAARAGALDHAEALFRAAGFDRRGDDPAALAVLGRLRKDRAERLPPAARAAAFAAAAEAYAAAEAILPQPYTRINLASLTMLAGDVERARGIAGGIIDWLATDPAIHETAYYLAATIAEAHLIRGEADAAQAAMARAVAAAPRAYEDHAVTIRQLRLIARHAHIDDSWLKRFRPPRSMHFAGHLAVAADPDPALLERIDAVIADARIGFAFGAIAAGADLTIAERVLTGGGELHVVLPLSEDAFVTQSVLPFGADWLGRFRTCRDAAESWTETASDTGAYEPLASRLAAEVAMGAAVRHARAIGSEAIQLVVIDDGEAEFGTGLLTASDARRWHGSGRRSHIVRSPRAAPVLASGLRDAPEGCADRRLAAMLQIDFAGLDGLDEAEFAQAVGDVLQPWRTALAEIDPRPRIVLPCGNSRLVAFDEPEAALAFARRLLEMPAGAHPVRIAGHYGLAHWLDDPDALVGRSVAQLGAIATAAFPGTITVSETFASALFLAAPDDIYAEPLGEAGRQRLFAIRFADARRTDEA